VQLLIRAGAVLDPPGRAGRAFLTADLLDEGTATRDAMQIADEAELLAASLGTQASWDYCAASLHVLAPRMEPALELLADVLLQPAFRDDDVVRKKRQRLHAIAQELDDPRVIASRAFARLVHGDSHPYGSPVGGTRESIERLGADDLHTFHRLCVTPDNAAVVICGDIAFSDAVARMERHFAAWRRAAGAPDPAPVVAPPPQSAAAVHIIDRPGAPQSELRVGLPGPPRGTADYFPLQLANSVLGGAFTSRLNMLLREEKGYTYGAGSSFAFRRDGGPFLASTAVATSATADAVHDIVREIERMTQETVPAEELERAQNYLVLGLPRSFETTAGVAEHVSAIALYGLPGDYYETYSERIRSVTASDVREACRRWLRPAELTVVVAGDANATAGELEELGIGAVHVRNDG
jgi:zinc protease